MKRLKKPKAFTIDRAKWWRGKGPDDSRLWTDRNCGCCLGHYAIACGIDQNRLVGIAYPSVLANADALGGRVRIPGMTTPHRLYMNWTTNSQRAIDLANANDDPGSDATRERRIRAGFRKIGVRVRFVGKGNPAEAAQ